MNFFYVLFFIIVLIIVFWKFGRKNNQSPSYEKKGDAWKQRIKEESLEQDLETSSTIEETLNPLEDQNGEEDICEENCRLDEVCVPVYNGNLIRTPFGEGIYIKAIDGEKPRYLAFRRGFRVNAGARSIEFVVYSNELKKGFTQMTGETSYYGPVQFNFLFERGKEYEISFQEESLSFICQEKQ